MVSHLKQKGYEIALISGGMDILVEMVARELEIKLFAANNIFVFDENNYLQSFLTFDHQNLAKVRHLQSFARQLGITLEQCVCVGDGANDIELFKKSKHRITFEDSKIKDYAWKVVKDLREISSIL